MKRIKKVFYSRYHVLILNICIVLVACLGIYIYYAIGPQRTAYTVGAIEPVVEKLLRKDNIILEKNSDDFYYFCERYTQGVENFLSDNDYIEVNVSGFLSMYYYIDIYNRFTDGSRSISKEEFNDRYAGVMGTVFSNAPYNKFTVYSLHNFFRNQICVRMREKGWGDQRDFYKFEVSDITLEQAQEISLPILESGNVKESTELFEEITLDRDKVYEQSIDIEDKLVILSYARIRYIYQRAEELGLVLPYSWQQAQDMTLGELEPALNDVAEQINADPSQEQRNRQYQSPYAHLGIWPSKMMNR
ncbi:hypothetical protein [Neobittarella massiliensis]|uniref:hypothetical protein n=1 Tax=Neobittarella massiliensis (ex Bilen et al. 2018) TaxID=2041842 RepID=UPI000CF62CB3|nr:hypothetical protein [Neobittarella massiliensis]